MTEVFTANWTDATPTISFDFSQEKAHENQLSYWPILVFSLDFKT